MMSAKNKMISKFNKPKTFHGPLDLVNNKSNDTIFWLFVVKLVYNLCFCDLKFEHYNLSSIL